MGNYEMSRRKWTKVLSFGPAGPEGSRAQPLLFHGAGAHSLSGAALRKKFRCRAGCRVFVLAQLAEPRPRTLLAVVPGEVTQPSGAGFLI